MEGLEVGRLGLVPGLDQSLERGFDQLGDPAAEDDLLAEEVGLGLLLEGGLEDPGPPPADRRRIREGQIPGVARGVLMDGDQTGHPDPCS